ncbi:class I SAM-dependent methyltransferase [Defluviitalea phaphyphila]|uniref:class I SAM-dependent methyltransferase n=1 Tax=Defluviitalea phaphyphila TaxID=1473580 RepID=UPI00073093D8|nr:class I SAM-dependent methyltransferase [Defluviitalea phaphyphila]
MGFYDTLSNYYDKVFPLSLPCKTFIEKNISKNKLDILDVGCSTGELDIFLGKKGHNVLGIDLDKKMIEIAKDKIKGEALKVEFKVMNMEELETNLSENKFDIVICIGNTLVHLSDIYKIKKVLKQMFSLLNPGGKIILQIINYDRIIAKDIKKLPLIENEDISFIREYDYNKESNKVIFKTTLEVKKENLKFENEISLFPLRFEELKTILYDLGFKNMEWYGNFNGVPYQWDSYATVVTAQK